HHNMGGLDIFWAKIVSAEDIPQFGNSINMGYPINSSKDDFGMLLNDEGDAGYFSSNRQAATMDNIYSFKKRDLRFTVDGLVVERATENPVEGATVELKNKDNGKRETVITTSDGKFTFKLDPNADYQITGSKDDFYSNSESVSTRGKTFSEDMTVKIKLALEKIVLNKPIVLDNIYYDLDKSDIRPDAAVELDKLVAIMNENPGIIVELGSHTDARAEDKYNLVLSQKRAQSAVDYIITHGIAQDRITAKGYGETRLLNRCKNKVKC